MRTLLILAANPKGTERLRLDEEVKKIEQGLERSKRRDQFRLVVKWAVTDDDLRRALLDNEPEIVHFCGHGSEERQGGSGRDLVPGQAEEPGGLAFEDDGGRVQLIHGTALARLFELCSDTVKCVVLNACYSESQANALSQHIDYVVGMKQAIGDEAAIKFAVGFYDALGAGRDFEKAYKFGCSAIDLKGIPEHLTPILKKRSVSATGSVPSPSAVVSAAGTTSSRIDEPDKGVTTTAEPSSGLSAKTTGPISVFYSYSHKDEPLRDELEEALALLKRQGLIAGWHDRKIGTGEEWKGAIDKNLEEAQVILLLISSSFLASDYCWDIETKRAIERHDRGAARVIPVILRPCDWQGAPFGKLQGLPKDAKPVTSWANKDEAWTDVAKGIRGAVEASRRALSESITAQRTLTPGQNQPFPGMGVIPIRGIRAQDWPTGEQHHEDWEERGSIRNETYRWEVRALQGGVTVQTSSNIPAASDFDLEAHLRLIQGANLQYGLFFRKSDEAGYFFLISNMGNQGGYGLNLWSPKNGQIKNIISWTASPLIDSQGGTDLKIVVRGARIRLFINDNLVGAMNDAASTTGQIGLAASLGAGQSATIEMSDFKLTIS